MLVIFSIWKRQVFKATRQECFVPILVLLSVYTTALSNSMKLRAIPCRDTQDGQVMVESSDKTWSTGKGNGKPLQFSCLENPMNSMKRQKDRTLKDELPRLVSAQHATRDHWRNNSRKNEETEPKQKQCQVVDAIGDKSKVRCFKEQLGTWNVKSTNQSKFSSVQFSSVTQSCPTLCDPMNRSMPGLPVHHQPPEFTQTHIHRVSDAIQPSKQTGSGQIRDGKSEHRNFRNQWTKMYWNGQIYPDDHYIYYCGQESLRRNGVALIVNKSPKCSTWVPSQKQQNDLVSFPRQIIQHHSNPSMSQPLMSKKLKLTCSMKTCNIF